MSRPMLVIMPGTGVVERLRVWPLNIRVASRAYHHIARLQDEYKIECLYHGGLDSPEATARHTERKLLDLAQQHGPITVIGHSQSAARALEVFVAHTDSFAQVITLAGIIEGTELARLALLEPGLKALGRGHPVLRRLGEGLAALTDDERSRLHCYAVAGDRLIKPAHTAMLNLPGVDNIWVGEHHPDRLHHFSRHVTGRTTHLNIIGHRPVLEDLDRVLLCADPDFMTVPTQRTDPLPVTVSPLPA